jgi:biopolymer transport protein ExbD
MRRKLSNSSPQEIPEPLINMTPLIDVVFVLLISFIVIAPLLQVDSVDLASGSPSPRTRPIHFEDANSLQIHVHQDNQIFFNGQPIEIQALFPILVEAKQKNPQLRPQVFHDKKAFFETYQKLKNTIEAAGFQELDMVLSP